MRFASMGVSRAEKRAVLAGFAAAMLIFFSGYLIGAQMYGGVFSCPPEQHPSSKNETKAHVGVSTPRKVHTIAVQERDAP